MLERADRFDLLVEAANHFSMLGLDEVGLDHLHRPLAAELQMPRFVDVAHAAAAEPLE